MAKALIPLADGVEEMEAVIMIDTLRRAGWAVTSAGIGADPVVASRGVRLLADCRWDALDPSDYDVLLLPGGGPGTERLAAEDSVLSAVRSFVAQGKLVGAICAGPLVLQAAGVLEGRDATCHPGVAAQLTTARLSENSVVVDGNIITSRGPGTAFAFVLQVIRHIDGDQAAHDVAGPMVLP